MDGRIKFHHILFPLYGLPYICKVMHKGCCYFLVTVLLIIASCNSETRVVPEHADEDLSIASLKESIRQHPDSVILKEYLIEAYRNKGSYDSALAIASAEIAKDSGNAYLWNIKATLYFENGDTAAAIRSLENAIDIYPLPEYLVALGTLYAETKSKNALHIADELLLGNRSKSAKDAYFIKGLYYNYTNAPRTAVRWLDSCLTLDYTYMYAYREKGIALYNEGEYEKAVQVLQKGVTIQNNFDEGYYWMGKCYEKLNKQEEAIQSYQNALLYDKNYSEAREALNRLLKDGK